MAVRGVTIFGGGPNAQIQAVGADGLPLVDGPFDLLRGIYVPKGCLALVWDLGATGDMGQWVQIPQYGDKSVLVTGGTVTAVSIQGSVELDGAGVPLNPSIIHEANTAGGLATWSAAGWKQLLESPRFIRPLYTTGATVRVAMIARKASNASGA